MVDLFRALQKAHASQREAQMTHGVYHVKKDGNLYKYPTVTGRSEAEATAKAEYLTSINPGSRFEVRPL